MTLLSNGDAVVERYAPNVNLQKHKTFATIQANPVLLVSRQGAEIRPWEDFSLRVTPFVIRAVRRGACSPGNADSRDRGPMARSPASGPEWRVEANEPTNA